MLLIDFYQHLTNNGVYHLFRKEGFLHDVYKNSKNERKITVPIEDSELMDEFVEISCRWLDISAPNSESEQKEAS